MNVINPDQSSLTAALSSSVDALIAIEASSIDLALKKRVRASLLSMMALTILLEEIREQALN